MRLSAFWGLHKTHVVVSPSLERERESVCERERESWGGEIDSAPHIDCKIEKES